MFFLPKSPKDMTAYQRLGYNSLMWCTGLPARHSLPNPIVVCTCSLSSVIIKLSYMFSHWFTPHVGLAIHANLRGWVNCTQFVRPSRKSHFCKRNRPLVSERKFLRAKQRKKWQITLWWQTGCRLPAGRSSSQALILRPKEDQAIVILILIIITINISTLSITTIHQSQFLES